MTRYAVFNHQLILSKLIFLLILSSCTLINLYTRLVDAGASSTPKNLANLSASQEGSVVGGSTITSTSSNQFQNEYQFSRQGSTKPISNDRHKSSTSALSDAASTSFDHLTSDLSGPGALDYSYLDSRVMTNVPDCKGRLKLNGTRGFITDGPGYYQTNLQCIWLIDSGLDNATIRIQLHQFNTECNYDFLYLFDGDSVYSPLVAALSGDMKDFSNALQEARLEETISLSASNNSENLSLVSSIKTTNLTGLISIGSINNANDSNNSSTITSTSVDLNNTHSQLESQQQKQQQLVELKTHSGKAFIYFHSDTAQSMPGFYMTYSIDSCPLDCSNRGKCDYRTLTCKCNQGYFGDGCQHILCPNNCNAPVHGYCDKEKSCVCHHDFIGADCSKRTDQQHWSMILDVNMKIPARAFHHATIIDQTMWVFGGKSKALSNTNSGIFRHRKTPMILSYDLVERKWNNYDDSLDNFVGETGQDHLAELSGHSVAVSGTKAFIYGGMAMNNTVLNTLTVFDTKTKTLNIIGSKKETHGFEEEFNAPLSVAGHSANIIDGYMYVFLGYNPLYGYLNFAQKFNIANNSWSIIGRRGSSVAGLIGHTSTFDIVTRLVYIYGGHNSLRSSKLYSFNPQTEVWTYLHSGPSPRYFHSAIIMNGLLAILGGNSYNTSHQSDQCFQQTHLVYDLNCSIQSNNQSALTGCGRKCWTVIEDDGSGVMKRHGHSIVVNNDQELLLYGGFNGIIMNDLRSLKIQSCRNFTSELDCMRPKLGLACNWNAINAACEVLDKSSFGQVGSLGTRYQQDCSKNEIKKLQMTCEARETCTDCLSTNLGCVWCGLFPQCQFSQCRSAISKAVLKPELCYRDEILQDSMVAFNESSNDTQLQPFRNSGSINSEQDNGIDCKVDNCYLCQSKTFCSWQNEGCTFSPPASSNMMQHPSTHGIISSDEIDASRPAVQITNSSRFMQLLDSSTLLNSFNKSFSTTLTANPLFSSSPDHSCDIPCFMRRSCNECTTTKCIWCSTTEQCIDSSAYFAYHAMGQCMHYVAYIPKCPVASCSDIDTCDKCLTNPKCGWLNDISNTGKGHCTEGTSSGPTFSSLADFNATSTIDSSATNINQSQHNQFTLTNWHYTSCPSCQCNGHSYCRPNTSTCVQPCLDYTEGPHCDRCMAGYFGNPVNGGSCSICECNGHAQSCNRETGKCYCSTKGITGHSCNKCDDKNFYIGDPSSPGNGTCYYNLTTDYQYTFNMSKPEDHFYSDINFVNVPIRKDSDADFSIACSRLALVNITSGTSYRNRRPIQSGLECGSFRLRFPHDRHAFNEANYSFFVHVYKFQTPFVLQISFSQHRTLYLPQFFFTFSSSFLFFFALSGLVWKLKHEYDQYVRRQRQLIEMEQMASRPFATVLLEMFRPVQVAQKVVELSQSDSPKQQSVSTAATLQEIPEPTPISFEPCFGSNIGVMSIFVQLPGRPSLAIGSALVSLNDNSATAAAAAQSNCEAQGDASDQSSKRQHPNKERISVKNL